MAQIERNSEIAANAQNIPDDSVDCGIRLLGWCRGPKCQKYARLRTFMIVLAIAGILQGACESYFRIAAKQAALEHGYNPLIVEWLLVSSGIFQAIFALTLTYWAHKLHPINWLSGTIMLQAATCIIAIIPAIMNFADGVAAISIEVLDANICTTSLYQMQKTILTEQQSQMLILVMLFILQFALGLGSLAFYTIGITYIDDNSQSIDSPAVIGTILAAKIFGLQLGSTIMLGIDMTTIGWWLGWAILAPLVFITGVLLSLFPKRLPKTVIHQAAQRIIEETNTHQFGSQFTTYIADPAFGASVRRLFSNKLLMFNIISIMFIQSAIVNYGLQEEIYVQSRFFLPFSEEDGLLQEWNAKFVSYFLKPPVAAISILIGGLIIAKAKLSGRTITGINITLGLLLLSIFIANIFIKCEVGPIAGITSGKLLQPFCSRQCICKPSTFLPVCPENSTVTYFSPCYAGCSRKTRLNNIELYEACSCGMDFEMNTSTTIRATQGACTAATCSRMLIVFQVLSLFSAAILGKITIGKVIITLRSVLPQDKGLALAMELMFFGLFTYIPIHLAYDVVTRTTCMYWAPEYAKCLLRETPKHGNILNILSASLILIGLLFDVLVFIYAKGINIYNCKVIDVDYTPSLYTPISQVDEYHRINPPAFVEPIQSSTKEESAASLIGETTPIATAKIQPIRSAPSQPDVRIQRNPSSLTNSSAGGNSIEQPIQYAQVVFPPDKHKPDDGTASPKRMAVSADVPLHHLSQHDVRAQLQNLRSFNAEPQNGTIIVETSVSVDELTVVAPIETDLDKVARPQSPETNF